MKLPDLKKKVSLPLKNDFPKQHTMNFATIGQEVINPKALTIGIVLIILISAVFGKVFVLDRYIRLYRAELEVAQLQEQVNMGKQSLEKYADLNNKYAHYTYADMDIEEMLLVDRGDILDLIDKVVAPNATIDQISISGNELNIQLSNVSLEKANSISNQLKSHNIVSYCSVQMAKKGNDSTSAQLTVYLENNGGE